MLLSNMRKYRNFSCKKKTLLWFLKNNVIPNLCLMLRSNVRVQRLMLHCHSSSSSYECLMHKMAIFFTEVPPKKLLNILPNAECVCLWCDSFGDRKALQEERCQHGKWEYCRCCIWMCTNSLTVTGVGKVCDFFSWKSFHCLLLSFWWKGNSGYL